MIGLDRVPDRLGSLSIPEVGLSTATDRLLSLLYGPIPYGPSQRLHRRLYPKKFELLKRYRAEGVGPYSLVPSDRLRCIFVHMPRTAGVSVCRALFDGYLAAGHTPAWDYRMVYSREDFRGFFKFTFVRNPWSRLYSAFVFLRAGGFNPVDERFANRHLGEFETFDRFVRDGLRRKPIREYLHFRPQRSLLARPRGGIEVDYVGRFEHLERDFADVCERLGLDAELGRSNASPASAASYREVYSSESAEIAAEVYRADADAFDYTFD